MKLLPDTKIQHNRELFEFNLLPPKTKAELEAEAKRAQMMFYAVIAPVSTLVIALVILFVNLVFVNAGEASWQNAVDYTKQELSNPNNQLGQLKVRNGELKVKTDFIAEPIAKNVDFELMFTVTDDAFRSNISRSVITSYGREDTGEFLVNAASPNQNGPNEILEKFKKDARVIDPNLVLVQQPREANEYRFTISFNIIQQAQSQQTVS